MQIGPTNAPDASIHHLSQNMFITHCSGPKISVRTRHPHWVMNLFAARVVSFQIEGTDTSFAPLLSLHSSLLSTFHTSFTSLCLCSIFFIGEILVNSEAPTTQQRTAPTRWCANIALRMKVFHLIIQGGIFGSGTVPLSHLVSDTQNKTAHCELRSDRLIYLET